MTDLYQIPRFTQKIVTLRDQAAGAVIFGILHHFAWEHYGKPGYFAKLQQKAEYSRVRRYRNV